MRGLFSVAILLSHVAAEAEAPAAKSPALPEPATFLSKVAATEPDAGPQDSTGDSGDGQEALRDKIEHEVEEKMKEHTEKKHQDEEEDEEAESDSTFLIFVALGLAAVARFICKGQTQREHSGYMIITDTSPTKKRETAAQFWMSKRTQSLDSSHSEDKLLKSNGSGSSNGMPASPLRPGQQRQISSDRGGVASLLSAKKSPGHA